MIDGDDFLIPFIKITINLKDNFEYASQLVYVFICYSWPIRSASYLTSKTLTGYLNNYFKNR